MSCLIGLLAVVVVVGLIVHPALLLLLVPIGALVAGAVIIWQRIHAAWERVERWRISRRLEVPSRRWAKADLRPDGAPTAFQQLLEAIAERERHQV